MTHYREIADARFETRMAQEQARVNAEREIEPVTPSALVDVARAALVGLCALVLIGAMVALVTLAPHIAAKARMEAEQVD